MVPTRTTIPRQQTARRNNHARRPEGTGTASLGNGDDSNVRGVVESARRRCRTSLTERCRRVDACARRDGVDGAFEERTSEGARRFGRKQQVRRLRERLKRNRASVLDERIHVGAGVLEHALDGFGVREDGPSEFRLSLVIGILPRLRSAAESGRAPASPSAACTWAESTSSSRLASMTI